MFLIKFNLIKYDSDSSLGFTTSSKLFLIYKCIKKSSQMLQSLCNNLILKEYQGQHNTHCTFACGNFFDVVYVCVRQF